MRWIGTLFLWLFSLGFLGLIAGIAFFGFVLSYYSKDLPDYSQLKNYEPPIVTRIYAGDGRLLAEYAKEKRIFVPVEIIPDTVKQAFLSAEDKNFYDHKGVDTFAVVRAVITNLRNSGSGKRLVGASTITQQVAKNFLLTNEVSYERKIKEAILALRMEKALSKDQLLELYLNEIFLGKRAYGVAAAALTYFDKPLDELTLSEAAYLAVLPKAPNNYHPIRNHDEALARRNWILDRMAEDGHITQGQAELAKATPLEMRKPAEDSHVSAPYFAEDVRRELEKQYGPESLYKGGLAVRTSLNPAFEDIAQRALREGLMEYDKRHGWRGAIEHFEDIQDWTAKLAKTKKPDGMLKNWRMGVVLKTDDEKAAIGFGAGEDKRNLMLEGLAWARKCLQECYALGPEITSPEQVLKTGDVIMVEDIEGKLVLRQIPKIQGAIIALDPHTGRVLAMDGGWQHGSSVFNRATQAQRQPGSAFKPFVYLAALSEGFTPTTRVLDAPFVIEQAPGDFWRPTNYSGEFYGPTPLRVGIEKSRNLMTVRLADHIGLDKVIDIATRFGIADDMKPFLSYALGAGETTLLRLTTAYAMLVNGGKKITPTFIDRIQDRHGKTVFKHDQRPCPNCGTLIRWEGQSVPQIPDEREQIVDERSAYQVVSIMEGVVQRGTARSLKDLNRPLAGKTGTTNKSKDTWFIGFSPDLVVGVFAGFDDPVSLGKRETGSSVAAPIFKKFMEEALKDTLPTPFRVPPGIKLVRVNAATGRTAMPGDENVIWEAFVAGTEPNLDEYVLDTGVISGGGLNDPYEEDPYGYDQFGYGDYSGTYEENNNDPQNSRSYDDSPYNGYTPSYGTHDSNDPLNSFSRGNTAPSTGGPAQQPARPTTNDPAFTGTGGLY